MEDKTATPSSVTTTNNDKQHRLNTRTAEEQPRGSAAIGGVVTEEEEEEREDAWKVFNESLQEVQAVLDRNRVLIKEVNENHESRLANNMVKNVALIQEINGNISKVVSLYSNLSSNFSSFCNKKNDHGDANGNSNS